MMEFTQLKVSRKGVLEDSVEEGCLSASSDGSRQVEVAPRSLSHIQQIIPCDHKLPVCHKVHCLAQACIAV